MKALIINIDSNYRSVYTGSVAGCLIKKIPKLKVTGFLSGENKLLETTGIFEALHFLDVEDFFKKTKKLSNQQVEKKISEFLAPVIGTKWDVVINLSSNLLGSLLVSFLDYKEVRGISMDKDLNNFYHSDPHSFFLANIPDDFGNYFHFSYLYRKILKRFEEIELTSIWSKQDSEEFKQYFENIKNKNKKTAFIIIDSNIKTNRGDVDYDFLSDLYINLHKESGFQPLFIGPELDENLSVVKKLKENLQGEFYTIDPKNEAYLSVIRLGAVMITDNLYFKSVADLVSSPSILISSVLNLNDFSIVQGSYQVINDKKSNLLSDFVFKLTKNIVGVEKVKIQTIDEISVYSTVIENHLPLLVPVGSTGSLEYASWWLGLKFLCHVENLSLPRFEINQKHYRSALKKELSIFKKKDREGIYLIATELSKANIKTGSLIEKNKIDGILTDFFQNESSQ